MTIMDSKYYPERIMKLRLEVEKLPEDKLKRFLRIFGGVSSDDITTERFLDIIFSEMSEDPDDEPGLTYIGRVEDFLKEIVKE